MDDSKEKKMEMKTKNMDGTDAKVNKKRKTRTEKLSNRKKPKRRRTKHFESNEIKGFTVLGEIESTSSKEVKPVLPSWQAHASIIPVDLKIGNSETLALSHTKLDPSINTKLRDNDITHFFPVQQQVIPWLLSPANNGCYYPPRDLCVSAPTGSGKTLSYVIPIIQNLLKKSHCYIRALVVLPVRDLAVQVHKIFQIYTGNTPLKVGLLIGQKNFETEQKKLVELTPRGMLCKYDILVATPGKLCDHLQLTKGICFHNLKYLVIDEADRMMEEVTEDWLTEVENHFYSDDISDCYLCEKGNDRMGTLTLDTKLSGQTYLQKILLSATLSHDPEKLHRFNLFCPKLFTSDPIKPSDMVIENGDFIGKFTTPSELKEKFIKCQETLKPLILYHLIQDLHWKSVVCFTKSVETTSRLCWLMSSMDIDVTEISSNIKNERRERILKQFKAGKKKLLVCSDVMTRGIDFENVEYVVSYDLPPYLKTYIHRAGRTARAGRTGTSVILLLKKEIKKFQKMVSNAGKKSVEQMTVDFNILKGHEEKYKDALSATEDIVKRNQIKSSAS